MANPEAACSPLLGARPSHQNRPVDDLDPFPSPSLLPQDFLEACSTFAAADTTAGEFAGFTQPSLDGAQHQMLPSDWKALSQATDMHSFAAVPITDGPCIVGQLTVGDPQDVGAGCEG